MGVGLYLSNIQPCHVFTQELNLMNCDFILLILILGGLQDLASNFVS